MTLTGLEKGRLRDALVDAFPTWEDLSQFAEESGLVAGLEADVGRGGSLKDIIWGLLNQKSAAGEIEAVLDAALAKRPNNSRLVAFARSVGRAPLTAAHEFLATASFDLAEQEQCWRKAFASQLEPRMIVFLIREADQ